MTAQWEKHISPLHEVEPVHTDKDIPIGIHFEQVAIHCVKHQTSEDKKRVKDTERNQRQKRGSGL